MDTKIATPWFDVILPGAWSRSAPQPGLTVFRSPYGNEQLSVSSMKASAPIGEAQRHDALTNVVRVRREAELRGAPQTLLSDVEQLESPTRASFTGHDPAASRRTATLVVAHGGGFAVFYLESLGTDAASFQQLTERMFAAGSSP